MVSFTGSTETGKRFLRYAADSNMKRVVLECGGKNPAVVFDDAEDLDLVAEQVVLGAFWNMGENCSATSRLIVHEKVKDELLGRIKAYMREWRMGDPLDPRIGSARSSAEIISRRSSPTSTGPAEKLELVEGGGSRRRRFIEPTVVDGVRARAASSGRRSSGRSFPSRRSRACPRP